MVNHDPRYDGVKVYRLDLSRLLPGDVLLTRNRLTASMKARAQSKAILVGTRGRYSHAMIFTTPPTVAEAIGGGVSMLSLQNTFFHDLENVRVLRYGDPEVARRAASHAMMFLGEAYSVRNAVLSVLPRARQPSRVSKGTFCSALVTTAYVAAGAVEFYGVEPLRTTPADFERMPHLRDVTDLVTDHILAPCNIETMSALDGDRAVTPLANQATVLRSYHELVEADATSLIIKHDLTCTTPRSFFQMLEFVAAGLSSLAQSNDAPVDLLRGLLAIDQKLGEALDGNELDEMFAKAEAMDNITTSSLIAESFQSRPDVNIEEVRALLGAMEQQIQSRSSILNDPQRQPGVSQAWDKWCAMTERRIRSFERRRSALAEVLQRMAPGSS